MTTPQATRSSSSATRIGYLIVVAVLVGVAIQDAVVALKHMSDAEWVPMTIALVLMSGAASLAALDLQGLPAGLLGRLSRHVGQLRGNPFGAPLRVRVVHGVETVLDEGREGAPAHLAPAARPAPTIRAPV